MCQSPRHISPPVTVKLTKTGKKRLYSRVSNIKAYASRTDKSRTLRQQQITFLTTVTEF